MSKLKLILMVQKPLRRTGRFRASSGMDIVLRGLEEAMEAFLQLLRSILGIFALGDSIT